jgi:aspartate racemase
VTSSSPLIGILGGMGPQAGLDLANKLITLTQTKRDQDHIPFILFSLADTVPDRTAFLLGKEIINPAYAIADQFEKMSAMGVTVAAMACNTAHAGPIFDLVLDLLENKGVKLRILNMVQTSVSYIRENYPQIKRVGLLATQGTYQTRLYDQALEEAGLNVILPDPVIREQNIQATLYSPDFGIKACPEAVSEKASSRIHSAIDHLHDLGAEAILLGCTELPLVVKESQVKGLPILDPTRIIAEELIKSSYPHKLA